MPITFPSNPSNADEYTFNGRTYTYNASRGVWLGSRGSSASAGGGGGGAALTVSDTAPTSASEGDLWFHSTLLETYVYYNSQWVLSNPSGSGGGGGGTTTYATAAELPQTATNGDLALVEETDKLYIWNDTAWYNIALINTAPNITQGGAGSYELATDGTPTVITLTATDPESVPVTWSYAVTNGSLTNGGGTTATVTQADNVFTITPTTTEAYAGTFTLTFSVTDGANIVNDVNSFSLNFVTAIEDSNYTVALITANNLSGTIDDASSNNNTINTVGTPELTTFSPYRAGGYSMYFNGTTDYVEYPASTAYNFGTNDFTVECWIYYATTPPAGTGYDYIWAFGQNNVNGIGLYIWGGEPRIWNGTNIFTSTSGAGTIVAGQWYHIAFTKESGTAKLWLDGTLIGSVANSNSIDGGVANTLGPNLGRWSNISDGQYFPGYIKDFRVIRNSAIYTSAFTPPTEPLEVIPYDAGTQVSTSILVGQKANAFADLAPNNFTPALFGNPTVEPFGPYDYDKYDSALHGGSIYFDGTTGDSVWVGNNTILSSLTDWTLDFWMYVESTQHNTPTYATIFSASLNGTVGNDMTEIYIDGTNDSLVYYSQGAVRLQSAANSVRTKSWQHVAISRTGSNMTLFLNGKAVDTDSSPTNPVETYAPYIGDRLPNAGSANYPFYGYISDMRLHRHGMYTGDFTPPTEVTASTSEPVSSQATRFHLATNTANIVDKSQTTTLTLVGNTTASTTQTKYASSSVYFDGTGDYVSLGTGDQFDFGTGDFTWEGWAYPTEQNRSQQIFSVGDSNTTIRGLYYRSTNKFAFYANSTLYLESPLTYATGQWYHVAVVRSGNDFTLYVDGTSVATSTQTAAIGSSTEGAYVGTNYGLTPSQDWNGYIEEVRITKGLARYTANFTPPTGALEG